jgi:hypothetical protein
VGFNSNLDEVKEGIKKLEDRSFEMMQSEEQKRKKRLKGLWDSTKPTNIHNGNTN